MSANVRLRQLSNLVRQKASLQAECACGHRGVLDAVRLRRYDDAAKDPGAQGADVETVVIVAERVAAAQRTRPS